VFLAAAALLTAGNRDLEEAQAAERSGQTIRAYLLYSQIAKADPGNVLARFKAAALRPMAKAVTHEGTVAGDAQPAEKNPMFDAITGDITLMDEQAIARMSEPPRLSGKPGSRDFALSATPKELWEKVGTEFGLFVIFDRDYAPQNKVRFNVSGMDYRGSLHALEQATDSFAVPLSERVILVAQDTTQKRTELESDEAAAIPIPDRTSLQDAQELAVMAQQTMEIRRFVLDPTKKMIYLRDRVSKVEAAKAILLQLAHPKPQVGIEVEFLSVSRSSSLSIGFNLQNEFPLAYFGNLGKAGVKTYIPAGFTKFLTFGGGSTLFGIGITQAAAFAVASKSSGTSLLRTTVMVADGQAGTMHIGDKYPIMTGGYFTGGVGSPNYAAPPQINFEDLGVTLKVTPTVHGFDEVSLDMEAEYKVLGNGSLNGIPVISTRKFQEKVRLRTSEYAVVAGLMTDTKSEAKTGIAGLASIPWIGWLFRQNTKQHDEVQTLLVIKPRLLNLPPSEYTRKAIWVGSETKPLTPL